MLLREAAWLGSELRLLREAWDELLLSAEELLLSELERSGEEDEPLTERWVEPSPPPA